MYRMRIRIIAGKERSWSPLHARPPLHAQIIAISELFFLEPKPTPFGQSQNRLRDVRSRPKKWHLCNTDKYPKSGIICFNCLWEKKLSCSCVKRLSKISNTGTKPGWLGAVQPTYEKACPRWSWDHWPPPWSNLPMRKHVPVGLGIIGPLLGPTYLWESMSPLVFGSLAPSLVLPLLSSPMLAGSSRILNIKKYIANSS